jgi:hypothetical protein
MWLKIFVKFALLKPYVLAVQGGVDVQILQVVEVQTILPLAGTEGQFVEPKHGVPIVWAVGRVEYVRSTMFGATGFETAAARAPIYAALFAEA